MSKSGDFLGVKNDSKSGVKCWCFAEEKNLGSQDVTSGDSLRTKEICLRFEKLGSWPFIGKGIGLRRRSFTV